MGRASELADELLEEAPEGAANTFEVITWILAAVLAGLILLLVGVAVFVLV